MTTHVATIVVGVHYSQEVEVECAYCGERGSSSESVKWLCSEEFSSIAPAFPVY